MLDLLDAVGSRITYPPDEQFLNWVEHLTTNDPFRQCNGNVGISDLVGLAASRGVTWYMAYKMYQDVDTKCHILSDEANLHGPSNLGRMRMPQEKRINLALACSAWHGRL